MYALLVASALVWGWVFVKIFNVIFKEESKTVTLLKKKIVSNSFEAKDTFELLANYKDPFLKRKSNSVVRDYSYNNSAPTQNSSTVRKNREIKKIVKEEKVIDWSFIKYKGRITRKSTGKILSLININGGDYSLEDGKEIQLVTLIKSHPDSIQVEFDGVKKYIKRNQN